MNLENQDPKPSAEPAGGAPKVEPPLPTSSVLPQLAALHAARPGQSTSPATGGELVIGRGIKVKGSIGACKTLVVEGELDATVEVELLQLLEQGVFKGAATVAVAELAGRLDGKLTVEGKLTLKPSARVTGEISYRRIVIEEGGELSGDIRAMSGQAAAAPRANRAGSEATGGKVSGAGRR